MIRNDPKLFAVALLCLSFVACQSDSASATQGASEPSDSADDEDESEEEGDISGTGETQTGSETETEAEPRPTPGPEPGGIASICGPRPTDDSGAALENPGMQFCGPVVDGATELCLQPIFDDAGGFCVFPTDPGRWNLKAVPGPDGDRYFGGSAELISVVEGASVDLESPIVLTQVGSLVAVPEGEGEVVMDESLTLSLPSGLHLPSGTGSEFGVGAVDALHFNSDAVPEGETVVAQWTFFPFGMSALEGEQVGLTINTSFDLGPGTSVNVYEMDKEIAEVTLATSGSVNGDGTGIELEGGVHKLSWILVTTGG